MLSSAIVVFLRVVGLLLQRREDDAVAVLVHGPTVTPVWGHDRFESHLRLRIDGRSIGVRLARSPDWASLCMSRRGRSWAVRSRP
jgi:hypothetical protein